MLQTVAPESCTVYHRVSGRVIIAAKNRDRNSMSLRKTGAPHLTLKLDMRVPTDYRLHLAHLQHLLSQGHVSKICVAQAPVGVMRLAAHLFLEEWHMRYYQHAVYAGISLKPLKPFTEGISQPRRKFLIGPRPINIHCIKVIATLSLREKLRRIGRNGRISSGIIIQGQRSSHSNAIALPNGSF